MSNLFKYLTVVLIVALLTPAFAVLMLLTLPLLAAEMFSGAVQRLPHGR